MAFDMLGIFCQNTSGCSGKPHIFMPLDVVRQKIQPGDLLEFDRGLFSHYALYIGNEKVINVSAESAASTSTIIAEKTLEAVCRGSNLRISNHDDVGQQIFSRRPIDFADILRAARSYEEKREVKYQFVLKNCEYYCTLWRFGKGFSTQVAEPELRTQMGLWGRKGSPSPVNYAIYLAISE